MFQKIKNLRGLHREKIKKPADFSSAGEYSAKTENVYQKPVLRFYLNLCIGFTTNHCDNAVKLDITCLCIMIYTNSFDIIP